MEDHSRWEPPTIKFLLEDLSLTAGLNRNNFLPLMLEDVGEWYDGTSTSASINNSWISTRQS